MRRVVLLINATLDGRCGHQRLLADDDLHAHAAATLACADYVLFGGKTYALVVPHWAEVAATGSGSDVENEFAELLIDLPKIVFSSSLRDLGGADRVVRSEPAAEVRRLRKQTGGDLVVLGSPRLAQTLRAADLLDEYKVVLHPVLVGAGPQLLGPDESPLRLRLVTASPLRSGAVALHYVR